MLWQSWGIIYPVCHIAKWSNCFTSAKMCSISVLHRNRRKETKFGLQITIYTQNFEDLTIACVMGIWKKSCGWIDREIYSEGRGGGKCIFVIYLWCQDWYQLSRFHFDFQDFTCSVQTMLSFKSNICVTCILNTPSNTINESCLSPPLTCNIKVSHTKGQRLSPLTELFVSTW